MNKTTPNYLFTILFIVCALIALAGAYLIMNGRTLGNVLVIIAAISGLLLLLVENFLLKRHLKQFRKEKRAKKS